MRAAASQPPWWRVALGFLIAPAVPSVTLAVIYAYPELEFEGIYGRFILTAAEGFYPPAMILGIPAYCALGTPLPRQLFKVCALAALIVTLPWARMLVAREFGDTADTLWLCGELMGSGVLGGAIFWLIVYGWRTPATHTSFHPPAVRELKIVKQGDGYLADATSSDADSSWRTEQPMSDAAIIKELLSRGYHQTDIGDAFEAADPGWVSLKSRQ